MDLIMDIIKGFLFGFGFWVAQIVVAHVLGHAALGMFLYG